MGNVYELRREILTDNSSTSTLFEPDGTILIDTLEDCDRDLNMNGELEEGKIYGETAIPYGTYEIVMKYSNHFKQNMPYIEGVKTHSGVMFHWGNKPKDSLGCVLTGQRGGEDFIVKSKDAFFNRLMPSLAKHFAVESKLYVQVTKSEQVKDRRSSAKKL